MDAVLNRKNLWSCFLLKNFVCKKLNQTLEAGKKLQLSVVNENYFALWVVLGLLILYYWYMHDGIHFGVHTSKCTYT